ncbi:hypothetical protein F5X96DRAFT_601262 [Biscogniauxia mediterranea]|nr:hypothetical protein F5X96DRAFT_601262 [Biscogniauxia mediterranea]
MASLGLEIMNAEEDVLGGNKASQSALSTFQGTQGQPLSYATKGLIWVGLASMVVGVWMLSPLTVALIPALLVPTLCLTYILAGTLGTTVVIIIQSILFYIFALALFSSRCQEVLRGIPAKQSRYRLAERRKSCDEKTNGCVLGRIGHLISCSPLWPSPALTRRYGRILHERNYSILAAAGAMGLLRAP